MMAPMRLRLELEGADESILAEVGERARLEDGRAVVEVDVPDELPEDERAAWFAAIVGAASPEAAIDWWVDRVARRPHGARSREVYADPLYHRPNFLALLDALQLREDDELLEIGCGGGAFLQLALRTVAHAVGVDHSPEMLQVAAAQNADALAAGRLELFYADTAALPLADERFSCAVSTGVLGFLPDAGRAFAEWRRVLRPGGRLAVYAGTKELRGTPAAPEPIASRITFYDDEELRLIALGAGFAEAEVTRPDLREHARAVGVPDEAIDFFGRVADGRPAGQLLLARR
jgi:SAM-dependent methyltransferase